MKVDFAFLADSAQVIDGKLFVMGGGFDTIWTTRLPAIQQHVAFVMRLLFSNKDAGKRHNLEIKVVHEDKGEVARLSGELRIEKQPRTPMVGASSVSTVMNIESLQFRELGNYRFEIHVNGSHMKSIPLRIAKK